MAISRRNLRKGLVVAGCLFGRTAATPLVLGLVLILAGGVLHWLSKAYLEQNRELTTAGPYRWTRNPFYVANLLIDAGIACVIGQLWIAIVYFPLWAAAYSGTIRAEEERLREIFGSRYEEYRAAVPRFWPFRRPLARSLAQGRFDLRNPSLAEGREYARLLGIALAPAAIGAAESLRTLRLGILSEGNGFALGVVLMVPALWVFKLGLAETFRRPEVRLLPSAEGARVVLASILLLPLLCVAVLSGVQLHWIAAILLLAGLFALLLVRTRRGLRAVGKAILGIGTLTLGVLTAELWLAIPSALWFALAALDEVGRLRFASAGSEGPDRSSWRYFPRIAAGGLTGLLAMGAARLWIV